MGAKKFDIEFHNPHRSYFPGQTVNGTIVVTSKKKIKELILRFVGQAKVNWNETVSNPTKKRDTTTSRRTTVSYQDSVNYFDSEINLLECYKGKNNGSSSNSPAMFPFSFILPLNLPSSYIGKVGQIMYYIEIKLIISQSLSSNQEIKRKIPFTLNGIVDLNVEPGASQSVELRKYKHLGCWCCRSEPVGFMLMMERKGFVPGEMLNFTMELSNQSGRQITGVSLHLLQTVQFHAKRNTYEDLRILRKIKGPQVEPGENETWTENRFQIPPIPPSRLGNCSIIDVQYSLQIEMKISGIGFRNLKATIPIIIGTIPLRTMFQAINLGRNSQNHDDYASLENDTQVNPTAPILLQAYPDLPPPSYAEATVNFQGQELGKKGFDVYGKVSSAAAVSGSGAAVSSSLGLENEGFEFDESTFVPNYVIYG